MNETDATIPMASPPISAAQGIQPQETLIQRGAFDPPSTPGTLGHLDRFDILRLLGEGGMGQVYLAKEPLTHTQVAIKIMRPETADDPLEVHRFLTEARHMYRLSHPHILRVLEVSDRSEGPYYVMPYIGGGSLLNQYKPGQPMPPEKIQTIAHQIAGALAHAHANGLIHRDIKPGNVLLDKEGNAYLTDFGLVRTVFNDSMVDTSASHLEGTAPYMSPAVARGEAEDTRCDIYAFGALLYELLSGKPPYTGRTPQMILDQILKGPPPPIRSANPKANAALVKIADDCMARELHERYATMSDVVADLERVAKGAAPLGVSQAGLRLPRLAAWAALLLLGVAGVAAAAAWAIHAHRLERQAEERDLQSQEAEQRDRRIQDAQAAEDLFRPPKDASVWKSDVQPPKAAEESAQAPGTHATPVAEEAKPVLEAAAQAAHGQALILSADFATVDGKVETRTFHGMPSQGIRDGMFAGETNLVRATIADGVVQIGPSAFRNCARLVEVTIPGSVTNIGNNAFEHCTRLATVEIPQDSKLTRIGDWAFHHCMGLREFPIPSGTTSIGKRAFSCCFGFARVEIPANVLQIGPHAFHNCSHVTAFQVDEANGFYSSVDGVLFNKARTRLVRYPPGRIGDYSVPPGVTVLDVWAFFDCGRMPRITLPASMEDPLNAGLGTCSGLSEIVVDEANPFLRSQDGVLFDKAMTRLISFPGGGPDTYAIPPGVASIETAAFENSATLSSITLPESIVTIKPAAFRDCRNLRSLHFMGGPPALSASALAECNQATVYHRPGTTGWGETFGGRPTAEWKE